MPRALHVGIYPANGSEREGEAPSGSARPALGALQPKCGGGDASSYSRRLHLIQVRILPQPHLVQVQIELYQTVHIITDNPLVAKFQNLGSFRGQGL